mgnify:CR=1 FL=1
MRFIYPAISGGRNTFIMFMYNSYLIKLSSKEDCYSFNNYIKAYLSKENLWGWYLWLYAFKKSIFNDTTLRFPKHRTYEDVYLTWRLLRKAKKIGTKHYPLIISLLVLQYPFASHHEGYFRLPK